MKKLILLLTAVVFLGLLCQGETVDEIIAKNMEVKGGIEKLRAIKTSKMTGKMTMMNMDIKTTMWYKEPGMMKMEMMFADKLMTFAFDGNVVWQISPFTGSDEAQEVTGQEAEQVKDNADMMSDPLVDYKQKGHKIELEGKEEMEGTPVFKLKLTKKDGKIVYFFIDAESYIELKTQMTRKIGEGQEMTFETFFGDYKEVAGIMTAHSLKIKMNGQDQGNIVVESFEPNIPLDDNFFKMPEKKPAPPTEPEKK
jgi:outer membrane lipoprotein-sorting protein